MPDATEPSRWLPRAASLFKAQESALTAGILVVLGVIYLLDRDHAFYQSYSLQTLLHTVARFGVLAVGAAVVIIAGGIDLSTGAVVSLASVVSAKLLTEWLRTSTSAPPSTGLIALVIGLTLLMGTSIGLGHALMINLLRLPPFIATLATMAGLRSLATVLCQNRTITVPFAGYRALGKDPWISLAIFACIALFLSVLMTRTVLGRHLFAPGGQRNGREAQRTTNTSPEDGCLRDIRDAFSPGRYHVHRLQRTRRQPHGNDIRADGDHCGRGRRL